MAISVTSASSNPTSTSALLSLVNSAPLAIDERFLIPLASNAPSRFIDGELSFTGAPLNLNLSNRDLSLSTSSLLVTALSSTFCQRIYSLDLSYTSLSAQQIDSVLSAVVTVGTPTAATTLVSLNLSGNNFSSPSTTSASSSMRHLWTLLTSKPSLRKLYLNECSLTDSDLSILAQLFDAQKTHCACALTHLSLAKNLFRDTKSIRALLRILTPPAAATAAAAVAMASSTSSASTTASSTTKPPPPGAVGYLGDLLSLSLAANRLPSSAVSLLIESIVRHRSPLVHLDLRDNAIDDDGSFAISVALLAHQQLRALHLSGNPIGARGRRYLTQMAQWNESLNELSFASTNLTRRALDTLRLTREASSMRDSFQQNDPAPNAQVRSVLDIFTK